MKSLGVFLFSALGPAYLAVSHVDSHNVELLEISPLGGEAQILVSGSEEDLTGFQKSLRVGDLVRSKIIRNCNQTVLDTYFHLQSAPIGEDLYVFEGDFSGDLLEICNQGIAVELKPLELRFPRFHHAKINLLMTGKTNLKCQNWLKELFRQKISFHQIREPGKTLRGLFEFEKI